MESGKGSGHSCPCRDVCVPDRRCANRHSAPFAFRPKPRTSGVDHFLCTHLCRGIQSFGFVNLIWPTLILSFGPPAEPVFWIVFYNTGGSPFSGLSLWSSYRFPALIVPSKIGGCRLLDAELAAHASRLPRPRSEFFALQGIGAAILRSLIRFIRCGSKSMPRTHIRLFPPTPSTAPTIFGQSCSSTKTRCDQGL